MRSEVSEKSINPVQILVGVFILRGFATNFTCLVSFFLQKFRNPAGISEVDQHTA